ncbi:hypothetical protein Hanom_Chr06g00551251 [Helianthus anomalus]
MSPHMTTHLQSEKRKKKVKLKFETLNNHTSRNQEFDPTSLRFMNKKNVQIDELTFPSYSCLSNTSGAMYAGVPTVDFGCECSTEDCNATQKENI